MSLAWKGLPRATLGLRLAWSLCATLVAATAASPSAVAALPPVSAGHPSEAEPPAGLPVAWTVPGDGASPVRPDTGLEIALDGTAKKFRSLRAQLAAGHLGLSLNGVPLPFTYDATRTVLRADPPLLARYTTYTVELRVKSALHARVAEGRKARFLYAFTFRTGSDLGEPTHAYLETSGETASVLDGFRYAVRVEDDYGLPARNARVEAAWTEHGHRLPGSARAEGGPVDGRASFTLLDGEAEPVDLVVGIRGPYTDGHDDHELFATVRFLPGPPRTARLSSDTQLLRPGTSAALRAHLEDAFGNPVPGVATRFTSPNPTARFDPAVAATDEEGDARTRVAAESGDVAVGLEGEGFRFAPGETGLVPIAVARPRPDPVILKVNGVTRDWVYWPDVYDIVYPFRAMSGPVTVHQSCDVAHASWWIRAPAGSIALSGTEVQGRPVTVTGTLPADGEYSLIFPYGQGQYGTTYCLEITYTPLP